MAKLLPFHGRSDFLRAFRHLAVHISTLIRGDDDGGRRFQKLLHRISTWQNAASPVALQTGWPLVVIHLIGSGGEVRQKAPSTIVKHHRHRPAGAPWRHFIADATGEMVVRRRGLLRAAWLRASARGRTRRRSTQCRLWPITANQKHLPYAVSIARSYTA